MVRISVLGPLEVSDDGRAVPVPGGKSSELLVRLALDAGTAVRTDRLVDELWHGAVGTRRNTLQSKVTRLRRAFGDRLEIAGDASGYRLVADPGQVDALVVLRDVADAARLLDAGDARAAAELGTRALELLHGDLLPAAGDGDWAIPHRARLDEARTKLIEIRLTALLDLGDPGDVIGELEGAVAAHPYQEGLWALLITALYRAGRQADALATYQRVRTMLADELGLDPGPRLQHLERQVLQQDPSLAGAENVAPTAAPTGNLPSLFPELVGRRQEIASLTALLGDRRLVELVGAGGIGKTALAIAVGRALTVPVWLVRLETATTADEMLDTLIAAMDVSGGETALLERLKSAASVVILDNCEHVVEEAGVLAMRLLDAAPALRILCTSQVPLGIDGEAVIELAPLELADAVALFARRAPRSTGGDDRGVRDLCGALDGLPLAIELAAARTKTLTVEEITRRLDDRFSVLNDPTSRKPQRRRALKATIGWSYELLFPDDKRGLWALATFAGGAPLPAVEAVLEALDVPAAAAIDVVGRLASRSLVIVDDGDDGAIRYRLLDSIRAFALESLAEHELTDRARGAHAAWLGRAARSSTAGVRSARQAEHLAFARAERANLDAALAWTATHDPMLGLEIVNGFSWAWIVLGDSRGAQRILTALEAAGAWAQPEDRAGAVLFAAWLEASTGHLKLAREHLAVAAALADETGNVDLQARCCSYLAYVVSHHGAFTEALELTDRADALYSTLDRPWDRAANGLFALRATISAVDHDRAVQACDRVAHWLAQIDDPWLAVRYEAMRGELARMERRFDDAVLHIGRAAATSGELGFRQTEAYQVSSLGRAQCQAGNYAAGAATLQLAVEKSEATGDVRLAALARVHLGRVLRALERTDGARIALKEADVWHREAGGGEQAALGACLVAALDAGDRIPGAGARLEAILEDARRRGDAPVEVFALDALGRIAAQDGDGRTAERRCAEADRRMDEASHFIAELDRVDARAVRQMAGTARRADSEARNRTARR